ncbi:MAG: shikimate kinase [Desulfuromonadales bacterium]|nr:shikimate kinase [Desulfuromonadales bacterium]
MNIVLIGYRGAGKSHVGKLVAGELNMPYISSDDMVVLKAGMSIQEIVAKFGWNHFRDIESKVIQELSLQERSLIDTGGGVVERAENMAALKEKGVVFWLKASVETTVARIKGDQERPSLIAGKSLNEEVSEMLKRRVPLYKAYADYEIDTDNAEPDEIARKLIVCFEKGLNSSK